ncbi:hypothetical protein ETB97_012193 [Aspergillus alliaceus]|uniref:Uncharacterized protein n=1 Tax=Petromyces alliaceus TaxID=209559 RepID=A0A8H6A7C0_PETAA|nr:hypothetical protein ETB97_012193 [Aspergillus burnettii]
MKRRLGSKEMPTVDTVDGFRRDFEAGLLLRRGYNMPDNISITVREWIKQGLKEKVGLCKEEMEKDGLSPNDLTILMTQISEVGGSRNRRTQPRNHRGYGQPSSRQTPAPKRSQEEEHRRKASSMPRERDSSRILSQRQSGKLRRI